MSSLVLIDTQDGSLTRIETGGEIFRKTHYALPINGPTALTAKMVENFRTMPGEEFSLTPPPEPTNSPTGVGTAGGANDDDGGLEIIEAIAA